MLSLRHSQGFSLIEAMVALLLGLFVSLAAVGVFISNAKTSAVNQNIARIQESSRISFEMMVRDLREAGGNPCSKKIPVGSVLNNAGTAWWARWNGGLNGYNNGELGQSAPGTDAIEVMYGASSGATVVSHNPNAASFKVLPDRHGFAAGDILMVCDYRQAVMFQMTGPNSNPITNGNMVHNTGAGTPGNCSKGLGFKIPMDCSTNGTSYQYGSNSLVVKHNAIRWFVAENNNEGLSLFRQSLNSGTVGNPEEIISGVSDLQISYLIAGSPDYVDSTAVGARWSEVVGVRVVLTLQQDPGSAEGLDPIEVVIDHTVALRARLS